MASARAYTSTEQRGGELASQRAGAEIRIADFDFDLDKDGTVDPFEQKVRQALHAADTDGSGTLSPAEFIGVLKTMASTEKEKSSLGRKVTLLSGLVVPAHRRPRGCVHCGRGGGRRQHQGEPQPGLFGWRGQPALPAQWPRASRLGRVVCPIHLQPALDAHQPARLPPRRDGVHRHGDKHGDRRRGGGDVQAGGRVQALQLRGPSRHDQWLHDLAQRDRQDGHDRDGWLDLPGAGGAAVGWAQAGDGGDVDRRHALCQAARRASREPSRAQRLGWCADDIGLVHADGVHFIQCARGFE
eukprot:3308625-Prymnesium_polylepis.2